MDPDATRLRVGGFKKWIGERTIGRADNPTIERRLLARDIETDHGGSHTGTAGVNGFPRYVPHAITREHPDRRLVGSSDSPLSARLLLQNSALDAPYRPNNEAKSAVVGAHDRLGWSLIEIRWIQMQRDFE